MFQEIGWIQFFTYLTVGLALYGATVAYLYYRKDLDILRKNGVLGPTEADRRSKITGSIIGSVNKLATEEDLHQALSACEACGHVPGTEIELPHRIGRGSQPVTVQESYPVGTVDTQPKIYAPSAPATITNEVDIDDSIDGAVDLEELMLAFSEASALIEGADVAAVPEEEAVTSKERVLSILGNDNLLNSELASMLAVSLDRELPTESFSARDHLEHCKAA